jgi:hypothetical protein
MNNKLNWQGTLLAIQPRIRLTRSFDQRNHSYLGYALRIQGTIDDDDREFLVGIGQAAQAKHKFQAGDVLSGRAELVADPRCEWPCRAVADQCTDSTVRDLREPLPALFKKPLLISTRLAKSKVKSTLDARQSKSGIWCSMAQRASQLREALAVL